MISLFFTIVVGVIVGMHLYNNPEGPIAELADIVKSFFLLALLIIVLAYYAGVIYYLYALFKKQIIFEYFHAILFIPLLVYAIYSEYKEEKLKKSNQIIND